ncbi:DUF417 family protein [Ancylobacter dichloromethanicus]
MNDLLHTRFTVAERNSGSMSILAPLRWSLVVIFIWFGCMKFTSYEAHGIAGLIANSPFMSSVARAVRHRRRCTNGRRA